MCIRDSNKDNAMLEDKDITFAIETDEFGTARKYTTLDEYCDAIQQIDNYTEMCNVKMMPRFKQTAFDQRLARLEAHCGFNQQFDDDDNE